MLLDCGVHRIWSKVQLTGPRHSAVIKLDLCKQRRVSKRCESSSVCGVHHCGHIDSPGEAVGKCNPEPEPRKGFDLGYPPRRPGYDLGG